ncbi:MAG TPA: AmmeMemoRadiSam system protein B [Mariprofundaceae bacterium]|nr:AmmeMemoRadiSam system protein B [Mariprofundaceae bacterium]
MRIRPATVAGSFYPADAAELTRTVDTMLAQVSLPAGVHSSRIIIAPHAGYIYSGTTAARAYKALPAGTRKVAILGPVHRVPLHGLALPDCDAFATPLGAIPLDRPLCNELIRMPGVSIFDAAHRHEHGLEVHLPFLQRRLGEFSLIPLVVGDASAAQVGAVIDRLRREPDLAIVISSDLSHFHDYASARNLDQYTVGNILAGRMLTNHEQACGATPINGLLHSLKSAPLEPVLIHLCNSGDTAGDRDRVVGYAAIAFQEPEHAKHA